MKHTPALAPGAILTVIASMLTFHSVAQSTGDYRSAGTGNWAAASTWQIFDGSSFVAAPDAPGSSDGVITIRANHIITQSGDITVDQVDVQVGGSLIHNGGVLTLLDGTGTDLSVEGTWSMSGGTLAGPGTAQASNVGSFNWSGGVLGTTAVVNIGAGASATLNGSGLLEARGTINNAGTVTMTGGGITGGPNQPATFNNLPNGVVELNGWTTNAQPWHMVTNNQGTFNKNNGTVPFTFGNDFSGKAFNNLVGGVLYVATGECLFSVPTTNEGSMTGGAGSLIKVDGNSSGGFFTNGTGGAVNTAFELFSSPLNLNGPLTLSALTLSGGVVNGPEAITLPSGGTFTWTGGALNANSVLNIQTGAIANASGAGTREALGIINNSGTWNMLGGNFGQPSFSSGPCTFNNLPGGSVNLNGWESTTNSWHQMTNNQGTFTKNNGAVTFTFSNDFSLKAFNNLAGGVLNVATGECVFSVPTTNEGSMAGGMGSLLTLDGNASGGFFTNEPGGMVSTAFQLVSSDLNINGALALNTFTFSGGIVHGPEAVTITNGGSFTWTGGILGTTAVINIGTGASATFNNAGEARGTINNAGTWTMINGKLTGGPNSPAAFNNLPNGVVDLNGWTTNTEAWHMVTINQGTFNKNNGTETFTFGNEFAQNPKSFTNAIGGVVNVNSGTLAFNLPFPLQNGTFNVAGGTALTSSQPFDFAGSAIVNNGSITAPVLRYQGTSAQQLNGTGTINNLTVDNAAGVDLGGEQTVTNALTLTTGQLRLGSNDLFVENNAAGAVAGGNATSWVLNNGTGSLHRQVNGSSYLYPVGTSSYTPVTVSLTNGPQERFSVRVVDGVSTSYGAPGVFTGTLITTNAVDRTWVLSEDVSGGNTADITAQWGTADELALFNRNLCAVSRFDGADWVIGGFAPSTGTAPFTRTLTGVTAFREFSVIDNLLDLSTSVVDPSPAAATPRLFPQPADQVLHVAAADGHVMTSMRLLDASGRVALQPAHTIADRATLDVSKLAPGVYALEWSDGSQSMGRASVMITR